MNFKEYAKNNKKNADTDDLRKTYDETVRKMRGKSQKELMDEIVKKRSALNATADLTKQGSIIFTKPSRRCWTKTNFKN